MGVLQDLPVARNATITSGMAFSFVAFIYLNPLIAHITSLPGLVGRG
eukprot:COSAG02_NODE_48044_length_336_cov_1.531646_2_plen_46_part_01